MWALTVLVLLWKCGNATCLPPPLARIMQASEQALVNEGLQERADCMLKPAVASVLRLGSY